ncbi:M4 family metallopeptidase [Actinoplanes sp. NPDC051470]|uniref:M4 family metallopeptidase n=1 Tax=unclassified Actinoplanes TaxID=2626549 RepID=UPI003426977D
MRPTHLFRASMALAAGAALTLAASPTSAGAAPAQAPSPTPAPSLAATAADRLVSSPAADAKLHLATGDALQRTGVVAGTRGLQYVTYQRTHQGLAVVGGDVVVTTDATGAVKDTAVAQSTDISVATTAKITAAQAVATAKAQLAKVDSASGATLKVLAFGAPTLVYEVDVTGTLAGGKPSNRHIFVDATSGTVADSIELVREGTGNGYYYGNVSINTSGSGSSYSLTDTTRPGLKCGGQNGSAYTGTDDAWGNGSGTNLETACVDALYGVQREADMVSAWFNRSGILGNGNTPPVRVGLADVNAYWNGSYTNFGHNQANTRQATPIDVVAHEMGHAIFQSTPGGAGSGNENGGINESTGDIFGALTEAYTNNPLDPPDFQVGEEVDLVGDGPIRYMYNPSLAGDPNCWSSSIPSTEVHAAAGPLNHWFYLVAQGSSPSGGPASPTCNSSTVTGISTRTAGEIYYNALQSKTSTWKYANIRTATLNAAKNLYPNSCANFDTVKAAWNAISVPAQSGEPTCGGTTPPDPTGCTGTNAGDVSIPDAGAAVTSTITISGCGRSASSSSKVDVNIVHTWRGDLVVDLVAPDGSSYRLKSSSGSDSADNVIDTYTVNVSSETADGAWKLKVQDVASQDTGYINTWTLTV